MEFFTNSDGSTTIAVGYYSNNAGVLNPLVYTATNGGQIWSATAVFPASQGNSALSSIACDSSGVHCTTVGYLFQNNSYHPLAYYSTNGGQTWTLSSFAKYPLH